MTPDCRILRALHATSTPLPFPELAAQAQMTPDMLEERIGHLRAAGYEIALQPHQGYRLIQTPDRLIADDLAARLPRNDEPERDPASILVFAETASTNDVVARLARSGAAEGVVVFAEKQTAGRGRMGRRWESAAHKGLWFSMLLRPDQPEDSPPREIGADGSPARPALPHAHWSRITTWAAVAIARGIEEAVPGFRAGIKWPNDVYLQGRKAVGILIESSFSANATGFVVVGIGVNVNHVPGDFPEELSEKATSLRLAAGPDSPPLDRQMVAVALLRNLEELYRQLPTDFPAIVTEAESRSVLLGKRVAFRDGDGDFTGIAQGLEPDGRLRVCRGDGSVLALSAGEVTVAGWE